MDKETTKELTDYLIEEIPKLSRKIMLKFHIDIDNPITLPKYKRTGQQLNLLLLSVILRFFSDIDIDTYDIWSYK